MWRTEGGKRGRREEEGIFRVSAVMPPEWRAEYNRKDLVVIFLELLLKLRARCVPSGSAESRYRMRGFFRIAARNRRRPSGCSRLGKESRAGAESFPIMSRGLYHAGFERDRALSFKSEIQTLTKVDGFIPRRVPPRASRWFKAQRMVQEKGDKSAKNDERIPICFSNRDAI